MQSEPHAKDAKDAKEEATPPVLVREESHFLVNAHRHAENEYLCARCGLGVRPSGFPLHRTG